MRITCHFFLGKENPSLTFFCCGLLMDDQGWISVDKTRAARGRRNNDNEGAAQNGRSKGYVGNSRFSKLEAIADIIDDEPEAERKVEKNPFEAIVHSIKGRPAGSKTKKKKSVQKTEPKRVPFAEATSMIEIASLAASYQALPAKYPAAHRQRLRMVLDDILDHFKEIAAPELTFTTSEELSNYRLLAQGKPLIKAIHANVMTVPPADLTDFSSTVLSACVKVFSQDAPKVGALLVAEVALRRTPGLEANAEMVANLGTQPALWLSNLMPAGAAVAILLRLTPSPLVHTELMRRLAMCNRETIASRTPHLHSAIKTMDDADQAALLTTVAQVNLQASLDLAIAAGPGPHAVAAITRIIADVPSPDWRVWASSPDRTAAHLHGLSKRWNALPWAERRRVRAAILPVCFEMVDDVTLAKFRTTVEKTTRWSVAVEGVRNTFFVLVVVMMLMGMYTLLGGLKE